MRDKLMKVSELSSPISYRKIHHNFRNLSICNSNYFYSGRILILIVPVLVIADHILFYNVIYKKLVHLKAMEIYKRQRVGHIAHFSIMNPHQ